MIVDSSALLAIYGSEKDAPDLWECIYSAAEKRMSAATFVESGIVVMRRDRAVGLRNIRSLVDELAIEICEVTVSQARLAQDAFLRFGKGIHPAGLNFGDCFAYALAKSHNEPLLFKGTDFHKTDVLVAS